MTTGCVIDTNVLLYLSNPASPQHASAKAAIGRLLAGGDPIAIAPQVLFEFWSVATRPVTVNGLGWSVVQACAEIEAIRSRFLLLEEPSSVVDLWLDLVARHDLKGKRVHDAHLMATMKANSVPRLLTFNAADFPAEPGIFIVTP